MQTGILRYCELDALVAILAITGIALPILARIVEASVQRYTGSIRIGRFFVELKMERFEECAIKRHIN